jgi:putative phosphoesterase
MRIAVISDTHLPRGARRLPAACVERLRAADLIVHAGDLVSVGVLEELRAFGPPVVAVVGNVDEPSLHALLPERTEVEVEGVRIGVVHDAGPRAGREARLAAAFPGCAAVVYGHSHLPQVELHDGVWILNPGSPTERRRAPARSMIELEVAGGELRPRLVDLGLDREARHP